MPLKLVPPRPGKTPFYSVRGTHLGTYVDRSTKATERATAARFLVKWREEIERGALSRPGEPTFLDAAVNYMAATGNDRFLPPVLEHFGKTPLREINQQSIDLAAIKLYPKATAATRNRQVHTIVSAVLKHAGIDTKLRRPKGWRGQKRTDWLKPDQAFRVFRAADRVDGEFGLFLRLLCYTGLRLGEAIALKIDDIELTEAFAFVRATKNGDPRGTFLPPVLVAALANHPRGLDRKGQKLFKFVKCGRLYTLLGNVQKGAGTDLAKLTFHLFRHTWGTWMRRYGGLDAKGLVGTGAWRDEASATRYAHVVVTEESRKAILLPVEKSWKLSAAGRK